MKRIIAAVMAMLMLLLLCVPVFAEDATEPPEVVLDENGVTVDDVAPSDMEAVLEFLRGVSPEKYEQAQKYYDGMIGVLEKNNQAKVASWIQNKRSVIMIVAIVALMLFGAFVLLITTVSTGRKTRLNNANAVAAYRESERHNAECEKRINAAYDSFIKERADDRKREGEFIELMVKKFVEASAAQEKTMHELVERFEADRAVTDEKLRRNNELMGKQLELHRLELSQMAISQVAKDKAASIVREAKEMVSKDENTTAV